VRQLAAEERAHRFDGGLVLERAVARDCRECVERLC
jgi:hypothetical protein